MGKETINPLDGSFDEVADALMRQGVKMTKINKDDRLHEADLYMPTLRLLNGATGGFLTTGDLINSLENIFHLSSEDARILDGGADTKFSQIVRNMISHRQTKTNFIAKGFAEYDSIRKGLQITVKGRELLYQIYE